MRKLLLLGNLFCMVQTVLHAQSTLQSPDGKISITVQADKALSYTVAVDEKQVMHPSIIDLTLAGGKKLSGNLIITDTKTKSIKETITPGVAEKRKVIADVYNQLLLNIGDNFAVEFRAYNDGVAYRIYTEFPDSITVEHETAIFNFIKGSTIIAPLLEKREGVDVYHTSFESVYTYKSLDSLTSKDIAFSPVLIDEGDIKIGLTESDLLDYPGMFLQGTGGFSLANDFAPYPAKEKITDEEYPEQIVTERENFIAKTKGSRTLPWRVMMIAREDKELPGNDLVYRLATPSRIDDVSWIRPGKCTDEWIINVNLFNTGFKSGVNTASYKYYIDFAKRFGFDRIMMDAGWSDNKDLFKINPDINMDTLSAYAKAKGIKISMWTDAATLDRQLDSALR